MPRNTTSSLVRIFEAVQTRRGIARAAAGGLVRHRVAAHVGELGQGEGDRQRDQRALGAMHDHLVKTQQAQRLEEMESAARNGTT